MAFSSAPGWGNLPNGNFVAEIYSQKMQLAFRKKSLVGEITNSDYFGEISDYGDTVKVLREPEVDVTEYKRGDLVEPQDLDDEEFTLIVDKANKFSFHVEDIEKAHSHVDFMNKATDRAAYRLRDQFDMEILSYLTGYSQSAIGAVGDTASSTDSGTVATPGAGSDGLLASMKLKKGDFGNITTGSAGDHSIPIQARMPGATAFSSTTATPYQIFNKASRLLDRQNVPSEGRWAIVDPVFIEVLKDEDSRLFNADFGENGGLRAGDTPMKLAGFRIYNSNNLPYLGTGPETTGTANQNSNYGVICFGHESAVASAEQINKVESFRSDNRFADVVRGLHLYGRKILRAEGIVTAKYNIAQ